jgi:hypothetical protein
MCDGHLFRKSHLYKKNCATSENETIGPWMRQMQLDSEDVQQPYDLQEGSANNDRCWSGPASKCHARISTFGWDTNLAKLKLQT